MADEHEPHQPCHDHTCIHKVNHEKEPPQEWGNWGKEEGDDNGNGKGNDYDNDEETQGNNDVRVRERCDERNVGTCIHGRIRKRNEATTTVVAAAARLIKEIMYHSLMRLIKMFPSNISALTSLRILLLIACVVQALWYFSLV